ncbi:uncharacterized protein LOC144666360 isoform X1 [Oculina patagonica]
MSEAASGNFAGDSPHSSSSQWFKVVLLGDARAGKTSLIKALKNDQVAWELPKEYKSTAGAWVTYFDLTDTCRLLITDTSGKAEFTPLVDLYLRQLHCVVFVFALDEPSSFKSLNHWYHVFTQKFKGDVSKVPKFVVGTKTDAAQHSATLQMEATSFAEEIGAEMWITSAAKSFNTHELFSRIAKRARDMFPDPSWDVLVVPGSGDFDDGPITSSDVHLLDNMLLGKGALVRYPDPVLLNTEEEEISDLMLSHQCVTMTGENKTFKWGTWSKRRLKEAVIKSSKSPMNLHSGANKLWSCVMANSPPSTWQHETLEGVIKYGTTIRRQPTKIEFKRIKKLLFNSRDKLDWERTDGLFYMLLQSEDDNPSEIGLNSVFAKMSKTNLSEKSVIENNFRFKPSPVSGSVACMSMSSSHAAVVLSDNKSVSTWGHGKDGALGLEEHLVLNFDPPSPTPVTSINCQIKEVSCGADFTLMLTTEGQVYSCGSGAKGKLGHGDETDRALPTLIESLWNIQAIAAGSDHAVALTNRGFLYQWGLECADEALTRSIAVPTRVSHVDNVKVTSVACGTHHTVCVANGVWYTGIAFAWGRGSHGRLGLGHRRNLFVPRYINELYSTSTFVRQVSAGGKHTGFLTLKGEVYTCGNNAFGQLGYFTASGDSDVPRKVCLGKTATGDEIRAKELCCNEDYTMVLTNDGDVMLWGKCYYGSTLEDPIPFNVNSNGSIDPAASDQELGISDVTTCHVSSGESFIELVVALTNTSNLLFCAGIKPESDCQAKEDRTPPIRCNKTNLSTLCSVGSGLVSMDQQGKAYYVDIWRWLLAFLSPRRQIIPEDLIHTLFAELSESDTESLPPVEFTAITFCPSLMAVEASLSTFLFCSNIGDVYSWSPMGGTDFVHHKELDSEIIVQIACGAGHLVALSDRGMLFTCGDGRSGQLGLGTFQSTETFQLVPLTEFERVQTACCGWASTAALTERGKVYFWGQLDLPRGEKAMGKHLSTTTSTAPRDIMTRQQKQENGSPAAGYKVEIMGDVGIAEHHLAVVGKPFEVEILQRDASTGSSSCMEFRAEAVEFEDLNQVYCKGYIKQRGHKSYVASMVFYAEGPFKVSITKNGKNVLGSPFKVNAEKGHLTKRSKLSLLGSDMECMRAVGGVLQQAINAQYSGVELWGVPSITADLVTQEALMLASMTDSGIYIYVWDACCGNLSEENFTFWLHQLSLYAPSANVILLGVNLSAAHANEIDLKPFQKVNPMMKRSIFAGTTFASEPGKLLEEVLFVVGETSSYQSLVWHRLESLTSKVLERKRRGIELLDYSTFKCITGECGIQGDHLCRKAAEYLQLTGVGLVVGGDSFTLVLQPSWLARYLTEMAKSSHLGALDRNTLDSTKQLIVNLLIEKRVAVERMDKSTIDIIPFLSLIPEENWPLVDEPKYTIYRHLMLTVPPYHLHAIFQDLAANLVQEFSRVTLGKYSMVIYSDQYEFRIDCGPCAVNKAVAEVRVTVRSGSQDMCSTGAEAAVSFLQRRLTKFGSSCEISVKTSCSICRQYYVDLSVVQEAAAQGETERMCGRCHGHLAVDDLLNGFKDTRPMTELDWHPFHRPQHPGSPYSKPEIPTSNMLLRPLMRYFGDREERHGAKLLKDIKTMFEDMTKFFVDMKNYDVPRTVCLLPEFQRSSVVKVNAIKTLLTYRQPKYRLFLLCEGNGDGTGVHFLDYSKHKGYKLETNAAAGLIKESVDLLRFGLQLLTSFSSVVNMAKGLGLNVDETLNGILGTVGLSGTMLCAVPWKNHFKEMDGFLKSIEEASGSVRQAKGLSELSGAGRGCQVGGESYAYLRKILSELGTKDDFGGLRQEPREGIGAIWVCAEHSKYKKDTTAFNIMP